MTILGGSEMTSDKTLYVAETDETGQVRFVWVAEPGRKSARPIRSPKRHIPLLPAAQFSGASAQAITGWLKAQADTLGQA